MKNKDNSLFYLRLIDAIYGRDHKGINYTESSVERALSMLPKESADYLMFKFVDDMTYKGIADIFKISPTTIRNKVNAALRTLRQPKFDCAIRGVSYSGVTKDSSIRELGLSSRTMHSLYRGNVTTVARLISMSDEELLKVRDIGRAAVSEIEEKLHEHGFTLTHKVNLGVKVEGCKIIKLSIPRANLVNGTVTVTFDYDADTGSCTIKEVK